MPYVNMEHNEIIIFFRGILDIIFTYDIISLFSEMVGIRSRKEPRDFLGLFLYTKELHMNNYVYTTVEEQIEKLKKQQLTIIDKSVAMAKLSTYGYYNIINGYRDPYITRLYGEKRYNPGVTFEQIFALFTLDHNLRNAVLLSMIDIEEHLRAVVANIIGKDFGIDHHQYLKKNNYRDKKVSDSYFRRDRILQTLFDLAEKSNKEPIQYYRNKYGYVPPWILLKGAYFGTLVNYIRFLKKKQRDILIRELYGNTVSDENEEYYKDLLSDTLFLCLEYRNLAAHGGRVYNFSAKQRLRADKATTYNGISRLLFALNCFQFKQPCNRLQHAINNSLNEYCHSYPNDINRLEQALGLHIKVENYIWINRKTQKYHTNPHCSGSINCQKISFNHAIELGYIPCKKCCSPHLNE